MLAQGIDVRTVANVLGHSDVSTTLRTYVHSTEGATRRAAQAIGRRSAGDRTRSRARLMGGRQEDVYDLGSGFSQAATSKGCVCVGGDLRSHGHV